MVRLPLARSTSARYPRGCTMPDNFSLRNHIQQRKTQELQRAIEARHIERVTGQAPRPTSAKSVVRSIPVHGGEQPVVHEPHSVTKSHFGSIGRQRITMLIAGSLITIICL